MISPELNARNHTIFIYQTIHLNFSFSEISVTQHLISTFTFVLCNSEIQCSSALSLNTPVTIANRF